jgi:hypothetical protein
LSVRGLGACARADLVEIARDAAAIGERAPAAIAAAEAIAIVKTRTRDEVWVTMI